MTVDDRWASTTRVREAARELEATIRQKFPDAAFELVRASDQPGSWHLLVATDDDRADAIAELVVEREIALLVDEREPLHVIPIRPQDQLGWSDTVESRQAV